MNELIKIEQRVIISQEEDTVDARELWQFLGSNREFATWFKYKTEQSQAVEGQDFGFFDKFVKKSGRGRPTAEYWLTTDMAKHWAMLEGNDKGREARQYFIDVEKRARELWKQTQAKQLSFMTESVSTAIPYFKGMLELANLMDVPKHYSIVEIAQRIKVDFKLNLESLVKQSPHMFGVPDEEEYLDPTSIGIRVSVSGQTINKFLAKIDWQVKIYGGWRPTDLGRLYCLKHMVVKGNFQGYNWVWKPEAVIQQWENNPDIAASCLPKSKKVEEYN